MPKAYSTSTAGRKFNVNGPATNEEYDKAAGRVNAAAEDAVAGLIAWDTIPEIAEKFATELAKSSGVTRGVDDKATAVAKERAKNKDSVKDVPEKAGPYIKRVYASAPDSAGEFDVLLQLVADGTPVDPTPGRRGGIGARFLDKADTILERTPDHLEATITKLLDTVEGYELARDADGKPERSSLARLIKEWEEKSL